MDDHRRDALIDETIAAREEFLAALGAVDPELLTTPGLIHDWSARELIAHVGYWAGHAVETIQAVEDGRAAEFGAGRPSVDDVNETVARVARETDLGTVRKREAASFESLVTRLRRVDPALLAAELPHFELDLEAAIREDGPDHYGGHAADIRAWFDGGDEPEDDDDPADDDDAEGGRSS